MGPSLKLIIWNANGLIKHSQELKYFLHDEDVDIAMISETHFTNNHFLKIPGYTIYNTNHPDGTGHGGTAIIIKNKIKHIELEAYRFNHIQATNIQLEDKLGAYTISAIYSPPRHAINPSQYNDFFKTIGPRFIAAGDYNAKHTNWGSRITSTKGKNLLIAMQKINAKHLSTGEPTYWPTDNTKIPDLIDFCILKGMKIEEFKMKSRFELTSDHSPIQLEYSTTVEIVQNNNKLYNKNTDWEAYRAIINSHLSTNIPLKTTNDIESAIVYLNDTIGEALSKSTPVLRPKSEKFYLPHNIQRQINDKRKLRKIWQTTRFPDDKRKLNKATKDLKVTLKNYANDNITKYLKNLSPTSETNYSLWKATQNMTRKTPHQPPLKKTDGSWAKTNLEKATILAEYYSEVFSNEHAANTNTTQQAISVPQTQPFKNVTLAEVSSCIGKRIDQKKAAGYDQIDGKLLKELPVQAMQLLRNIFNGIIRLRYFPKVWKVAEIIAIPKPGKDTNKVTSYRPISLLPVLSKIFEKLLQDRLLPILNRIHALPDHQFGFRLNHSTIQQVHRVTHKILNDIDGKKFCIGVFLDVEKAFDKVWHEGLIRKLQKILPSNVLELVKSYVTGRYFYVKHKDAYSSLHAIKAGIPQGSVLGPLLYTLYTADMPIPRDSSAMVATFADDTVLLYAHKDLSSATTGLQTIMDETSKWFNDWGIKINEGKTIQVIYTNKTRYTAVPIKLNGSDIPIDKVARYLGVHIDNKLTWKHHIQKKRDQMKMRLSQLYWLLRRKSKLSVNNKLLIYTAIIRPIWTYGIQLWGVAKKSNIAIIQRQQSKILRLIINAEWYIPNLDIHRDLNIPTVDEVIATASRTYNTKLVHHSNIEISDLPLNELTLTRRLQRKRPVDLV